jgi:hypothetical protein
VPAITAKDWIDYLQGRLNAWTNFSTALLGLAGLIPASALFTAYQSQATIAYLPVIVLAVGAFAVCLCWIVSTVSLRRVITRHIIELILSGVLVTPDEVAAMYAHWMSLF